MIFASIGSMLPFDRLVQAVDEWAATNPAVPVLIQLGRGSYIPRHSEWVRTLPFTDYRKRLADSQLFVAHAGMGSILQALELRKPTIIMPRVAKLKEHVNDHQYDTCLRFKNTQGISIANDSGALHESLSRLLANPSVLDRSIPPFAEESLLDRIRTFLG